MYNIINVFFFFFFFIVFFCLNCAIYVIHTSYLFVVVFLFYTNVCKVVVFFCFFFFPHRIMLRPTNDCTDLYVYVCVSVYVYVSSCIHVYVFLKRICLLPGEECAVYKTWKANISIVFMSIFCFLMLFLIILFFCPFFSSSLFLCPPVSL